MTSNDVNKIPDSNQPATLTTGELDAGQNDRKVFNVATGIFKGFNDKQGIMLCGYEWGGDDSDSTDVMINVGSVSNLDVTFSNKVPRYGKVAESWPYDKKIMSWFKLWSHELSREDVGGDFEKCLVQTNWCDTQANNMSGINYQSKLLASDQVDNFIAHVQHFEPRILMFFGSSMGKFLNDPKVLPRFMATVGKELEKFQYQKMPFSGRRFNVGFQSFERCSVISLPHPSGSHGLSTDYIDLFTPQIEKILSDFKRFKGNPRVSA